MTEKHWCVHEVDVLKVRSNYVYLLGVQIHWRKVEVTMYNFIKCTEL